MKKALYSLLLLLLASCGNKPDRPITEDNTIEYNNPPKVLSEIISLNEDQSILIQPKISDIEGSPLSLIIKDSPKNGSISVNNLTITYTPNPNYFGPDSFEVQAFDGSAISSPARISLNILPIQDPISALNQSKTVQENTPTTFPFLVSENLDDTPRTLIATIIQNPTNGSASLTYPMITYTPNNGFVGADSIKVEIKDGDFISQGTISINITSQNQSPILDNISLNILEDTPTVIPLPTVDQELDPLTITFSPPNHGSIIENGAEKTYVPSPNYFGSDTFSYHAFDGISSSTATISINILPVNDAPVANSDTFYVEEEISSVIGLSGSDAENQELTFVIQENPIKGNIFINAMGQFVYQGKKDQFGSDSFSFKVFDGEKYSQPAVVYIEIANIQDPPVSSDLIENTIINSPLSIDVPASDPDLDPLSIIIQTNPNHGEVQSNGSQIIYQPAADFIGYDTLEYTVSDGENVSPIYKIEITTVDFLLGNRWQENDFPITIYYPTDIPQSYKDTLASVSTKWNSALGFEALVLIEDFFNQNYLELYDSLEDDINSITFQNESWFSGYDNVLAFTTASLYGDNFIQTDILFNFFQQPFVAQTPVPSNKVDFESVLLHELGHSLGLDHIQISDAPSIMNPTIAFGVQKRDLFLYDLQSIRRKYERSSVKSFPQNLYLSPPVYHNQANAFYICPHDH